MSADRSSLPPGHPFARSGADDDGFSALELVPSSAALGSVHGTAYNITLQPPTNRPFQSPVDQSTDYSMMVPVQSDDAAGTLLSGGATFKAGLAAAKDQIPAGAYLDRDGYYCYAYTGRVADLMARDAKKVGLGAALLVLIGVIIAVPVAVTSSTWLPELSDYVYPTPSPPPPTPEPPLSPVTPLATDFGVAPAAALTLCSWTGSTLPDDPRIIVPSTRWHVRLVESNFAPASPNNTFQASATLTINVTQDTACLVLAAAPSLAFSAASIGMASGPTYTLLPPAANRTTPLVVLDVRSGYTFLPAGSQVNLTLEYAAPLASGQAGSKVGLWRSAPYDYQSQQYTLASLDLSASPDLARTVLPCLDAPRFKSAFTVSIEAPPTRTVLGNAPVASAAPSTLPGGEGLTLTTFQPTLPMSTYLLGLVAGHLVSESTAVLLPSGKAINVSAWAVPGNATGARPWDPATTASTLTLAQETAAAAVQWYSAYFDTELPLAELKLVAVPGKDEPSDGWGLLAMDSQRMLFNPLMEAAFGRVRCVDVVCHELAHQWWGYLVTMRTWADRPAQDGLASWLEYKCIQSVQPAASALALSTRLTTTVGQPLLPHEALRAQADSARDAPTLTTLAVDNATAGSVLSNAGAAMVLGHMESVLELNQPGSFLTWLRQLLTANAYGTVTMDDLVNSWADAAAAATSSPAESLTPPIQQLLEQPGQPLLTVVTVNTTVQQASDGSTSTVADSLTLQQARFCGWGVVQDVAAATPTLLCPSADTLTWNASALASALPTNASDYLTLGASYWNKGTVTVGTLQATTAPVTVAVSPVVAEDALVLEAGGFNEVQRVQYSLDKAAALVDRIAGLNLYPFVSNSSADGDVEPTPAQTWRARALLDAWSVLSDLAAQELSPLTARPTPANEVPLLLDAINASLSSTEATTGFGMHFLVLPALETYERLAVLLGPGGGACPSALGKFMANALQPVRQAIVTSFAYQFYATGAPEGLSTSGNATNAGAAMTAALGQAGLAPAGGQLPASPVAAGLLAMLTGSSQDALLFNLSKARILTAASMVDPQAAAFACALFDDIAAARAAGLAATAQPSYNHDVDWSSTWEVVGTQQPPGCSLRAAGLGLPDGLYSLTVRALDRVQDWSAKERLLFAGAYTRNATNQLAHLDLVLAGLSGNTSDPAYEVPLSARDARQLVALLTRTAQQWGTVTGANTILDALLNANSTAWPRLVTAFSLAAGDSGEAALDALEDVVANSVVLQGQYDALAAWLARGAAALGVSEAALTATPAGTSAHQRLLGRALSNVQWVQGYAGGVCDYLASLNLP